MEICDTAISSSGGKKASLLPVDSEAGRMDVENLVSQTQAGPANSCRNLHCIRFDTNKYISQHVNGYTAMGEAFTMAGQHVEAKPENYRVASEFWNIAGPLFGEGKLITHPQKVDLGGAGLQGVLEGLQTMREGKVSGFKLVYHIEWA